MGRYGYHIDTGEKPSYRRTFELCKDLKAAPLTFYQGRAKLEDFLTFVGANRESRQKNLFVMRRRFLLHCNARKKWEKIYPFFHGLTFRGSVRISWICLTVISKA